MKGPDNQGKGENKMANDNKLAELLGQLAAQGIQYGDIMKALKDAKESGVIKSKGRGKAPENDPLRVNVREILLAATVDGKPLMDVIAAAVGEGISFMATLNDQWKVNFIDNAKVEARAKSKEKKDKTAEPEQFAEPAVA